MPAKKNKSGPAKQRRRDKPPSREVPWYIPRVIVKYKDKAAPPRYEDDILERIQDSHWLALVGEFPGIKFRRLFSSLSPDRIRELVAQAQKQDRSYQPVNFFSYFRIDLPEKVDPQTLVRIISTWPNVENVYFDPPGNEPCASSELTGFPPAQEYLKDASTGIDAKYAWDHCGTGAGQHFIDLERGWDFTHPDLQGHFTSGEKPLTGENLNGSKPHGTKVLGVVCADANNQQCTGITPELAFAEVVSYAGPAASRPDAISVAIANLPFGGVLLLEAQLSLNADNASESDQRNFSLLPIEIQNATFQMIRLATARGLTVVEAAGNGGVNFDTLQVSNVPSVYNVQDITMLKRGMTGFQDSGAIMVGAAYGRESEEDEARSRTDFSNFGTRVDCFAWGTDVTTLTSPPTQNGGITNVFDGTSSAAAIVAGATLAAQSVAEANLGCRLDGWQMRNLLHTHGTTSDPVNAGIRKMPDLKKITDAILTPTTTGAIIPDTCVYFRDFAADGGLPHNSPSIQESPDIDIPATIAAGNGFDVNLTVRNRGFNAASDVLVKVFLSPVSDEKLLKPSRWASLGERTLSTVGASAPAGPFSCAGALIAAPGEYVLIALLDKPGGAALPHYLPQDFITPLNFQKFISRNIKATCRRFTVN